MEAEDLCGGGDGWIKTCPTPDGSCIRVCDPRLRSALGGVVAGDRAGSASGIARSYLCWRYGNSRGFADVSPGGRKDAYSEMCRVCARDRAE